MDTTPDRIPEPDRDLVDAEADAAAAEAAGIGQVGDEEGLDRPSDPSSRPARARPRASS